VTFDVAVIGGGPAGSATATMLARRGRRVALFERSRFDEPRAGETFGGEVEPLLRTLGVWEAFEEMERLPFRSVRSAWGGPDVSERSSITNPFGEGIHVARAAFDALLARAAERAGASVRIGAGACAVERTRAGFRVRPARGEALEARFLVDASGRGAPASAGIFPGRRWLACDRMIALLGRFLPPSPPEPDLVIESAEDGWWYSAPQPGGGIVVVFLTDPDLLPAPERERGWRAALARTIHTKVRVGEAALQGPVQVVRADTGRLLADRAPGFCAVGDAAMTVDPLAGNGVARSLRSGAEAAEAIERTLSGETPDDSRIAESFEAALERRARYYLLENRWAESPFWARRRPPDWRAEPITLAPTSLLRWSGTPPAPDALAKVEALLPRRAISSALDLLRTPQPAHVAMSALRGHALPGDRRLLVGLQLLVEHGPLERLGA
jgi:flavin-dependent dehydrogenase